MDFIELKKNNAAYVIVTWQNIGFDKPRFKAFIGKKQKIDTFKCL